MPKRRDEGRDAAQRPLGRQPHRRNGSRAAFGHAKHPPPRRRRRSRARACPPCQASGDSPSSSAISRARGSALGVGLGDAPRVPGIGLVAAGDDERRDLDRLQLARGRRRAASAAPRAAPRRARRGARCARIRSRVKRRTGSRQRSADPQVAADVGDEAVDPALFQRRGEAVPVLERLGRGGLARVGRADDDQAGEALGMAQRVGDGRVRAHRVAAEDEAALADRGRRRPASRSSTSSGYP